MSTLKTILSFVGICILASCSNSVPAANTTPVPSTSAPSSTPAPTATSTPSYVRYVSTEPYAYYDFDDSFENVTDPGMYGITSALNTVKVNTENHNMGANPSRLTEPSKRKACIPGCLSSFLYRKFWESVHTIFQRRPLSCPCLSLRIPPSMSFILRRTKVTNSSRSPTPKSRKIQMFHINGRQPCERKMG